MGLAEAMVDAMDPARETETEKAETAKVVGMVQETAQALGEQVLRTEPETALQRITPTKRPSLKI